MEQTQAAQAKQTPARRVTTIPATLARFTATPLDKPVKRKVAGYARVSTDKDEQFTSYEAQIDYYTKYIQSHDGWEFVKVYTDEGITGTSTKHREGFKQMVKDALDGKIDLIVTKSVSRFARNTVDSLSTIRELKEHGVECYFEKENIWTFDGKGELLITIMSSLAQEESRSISENCTWGQRKRIADGKVSVPYSRFLGYDKGPDGGLAVNEEEAKVVREIYRLFLEGLTPYGIAKRLTKQGIPTPSGKPTWCEGTVRNILTNEKYKGDALLQKYYTVDYLTKRQKVNQGEVQQVYVEDDHPAIIDPEVFDHVQRELERRRPGRNRYSGVKPFSGLIRCAECGGVYGSKVWHSATKYRREIWQCNRKYDKTGGEPCHTPHLTDEELEAAFIRAANKALAGTSEAIEAFNEVKDTILDTTALDAERDDLTLQVNALAQQVQELIDRNARTALNQAEYQARYDQLVQRYEERKTQLDETTAQIRDKQSRRQRINDYLTLLASQTQPVTKFDPTLLRAMTDHITVHDRDTIIFTMKDGSQITA